MIIAANTADSAGNKMRVARIFPFHENAIATKDGGRAVTLGDLPVGKIDFCVDAETAHNPGDGIPIHLH